jgi:hypothetical protein
LRSKQCLSYALERAELDFLKKCKKASDFHKKRINTFQKAVDSIFKTYSIKLLEPYFAQKEQEIAKHIDTNFIRPMTANNQTKEHTPFDKFAEKEKAALFGDKSSVLTGGQMETFKKELSNFAEKLEKQAVTKAIKANNSANSVFAKICKKIGGWFAKNPKKPTSSVLNQAPIVTIDVDNVNIAQSQGQLNAFDGEKFKRAGAMVHFSDYKQQPEGNFGVFNPQIGLQKFRK